jgi:hypothetical protein
VRYSSSDDWFTVKTKDPKIFTKIAYMLSSYGKYIEKEASRYKLKIFNMEGSFSKQADAVVSYLSK